MAQQSLSVLILAAGEGTRMRSTRPKVLHEVTGRSLLSHVLAVAKSAGAGAIGVVIGPQRDDVRTLITEQMPEAYIAVQEQRLGTGHAVLQARDFLKNAKGQLLIAYGDTPLLRPESFAMLQHKLQAGADVVIGAFETANPHGYGRLIGQSGKIMAIREEKDASEAEKKMTLVNGGLMGLRAEIAVSLVEALSNENKAGEYYLPDIIKLAHEQNLRIDSALIPEQDTLGVNTRAQLAEAEALMQQRLREKAMNEGVTLVAPDTVFLSADTQFAQDVTIGPHVVIGPGVKIASGVEVLSFSHLSGVNIGENARIGPFARLRPGSKIGPNSHVGNFVEINRSMIAAGVEINHLTYLGDTVVGEGTNIGAGTITCNFDGGLKHATKIGKDVFIGSNSTLVAPLDIGDEVLVAAGSTVTKNAEKGGLVFGRVREQVVLPKRGAEKIHDNKKIRAERKAKDKA